MRDLLEQPNTIIDLIGDEPRVTIAEHRTIAETTDRSTSRTGG